MILPKTGYNYLKCILLCFCTEHRVQPCNMFAQNTCPMFFTKFYRNSTLMVMAWILVENSGVHLDCLWQKPEQKTWCQKISNVYQTDARYIFSNVFPVSSGRTSLVFLKKKCPVLCANILWEHISCFHKQNCVRLWWYVIWRLVKTSNVCRKNRKYVLVKCLRTKLDIFFSQKHNCDWHLNLMTMYVHIWSGHSYFGCISHSKFKTTFKGVKNFIFGQPV